MKTVGFDLDNTLVDCLQGDYTIYAATCRELSLTPLVFDSYAPLRRNGNYEDILLATQIVEPQKFVAVRNRIAQDERLNFDDKLILDIELLERMAKEYRLAIISSRNSEIYLRLQMEKLSINKFFSIFVVPLGDASFVAQAKRNILLQLGAIYFVGDKLSDVEATHGTAAEPILVETGFFSVTSSVRRFADVNEFIRAVLL